MPTPSDLYNLIVSGSSAINAEVSSINPTSPIFLYDIDLSEIYPISKVVTAANQPLSNGVLRLYNDINLYNIGSDNLGKIYWQGNYYYPFPIAADGFEMNSVGALPTPRLRIGSMSPITGSNSFYKYARMQFQDLGDIAGAKFSRIKTFLKFLHPNNFPGGVNPYSIANIYEAELPRDIYYIDRKSLENKFLVEYALASVLDIENITLPARTILGTKCPFTYRGEGCLYECHSRVSRAHSGVFSNIVNSSYPITLPLEAPPVETINEELFLGGVFTGQQDMERFSGIGFTNVGYDNASNSFNQWSLANITPNGTLQNAVNLLQDGSAATTALTIAIGVSGILTLSLTGNSHQVTRITLSSPSTINHNFDIQFSTGNNNWSHVNTQSGHAMAGGQGPAIPIANFDPAGVTNWYSRGWQLSGSPAGTYTANFMSPGYQQSYRLVSNASAGSTTISELRFSGEYRVGDSGNWRLDTFYNKGNYVVLPTRDINTYFVCVSGHTSNVFNAPPNRLFWTADVCTKTIGACRRRWRINPYFRPVLWPMRRGGWNIQKLSVYFRFGLDPNANKTFRGTNPEDRGLFPRRPDVRDPVSKYAMGIPKDYTGEYLNTFLPFGGFPGVNRKI